jgi:hypothetical protein
MSSLTIKDIPDGTLLIIKRFSVLHNRNQQEIAQLCFLFTAYQCIKDPSIFEEFIYSRPNAMDIETKLSATIAEAFVKKHQDEIDKIKEENDV